MENAEKIWKATEILMKVIDKEENLERKQKLIDTVKQLNNIHQTCMDDLMTIRVVE